MKKGKFLLVSSFCAVLSLGIVVAASSNSINIFSANKTYSLDLKQPNLTFDEDKGTINTKTENGNDINLSYEGVTSDSRGYLRIYNTGYISNTKLSNTPISGISSFMVSFEKADETNSKLFLYYGETAGKLLKKELVGNEEVSVNNVNYFFLQSTSTNIIYNINIKYDCSFVGNDQYITAGDTLTFNSSSLSVALPEGISAWKSNYIKKKENSIFIRDDIPSDINSFTVKDGDDEYLINFYHSLPLENNNNVHYLNDENAFEFNLPTNVSSILRVTLNDEIVPSSSYSFSSNKLSLNLTSSNMGKVNIYTDDSNCYRGYISNLNSPKRDETYMNATFGAETYIKIDSVETFKSYFFKDSKDLEKNLSVSSVYLLTADLDFNNEEIDPIGYVNDETTYPFYGKLYGNGHKLSNYKVTTSSSYYKGLFHVIEGEIYDLNIENASINGRVAGTVAARFGGSAKINNVNATNCSVVCVDTLVGLDDTLPIGGLAGDSYINDIVSSTYNGYNLSLFGLKR